MNRKGKIWEISYHSETNCFSMALTLRDSGLLVKLYYQRNENSIAALLEFRRLKKLRKGPMSITICERWFNDLKLQRLYLGNQAKDAKWLVNSKLKKLQLLLSNRRWKMCRIPAALGQYLVTRISHIQRWGRSYIRNYSFIRTKSLLFKNCSQVMRPPDWIFHWYSFHACKLMLHGSGRFYRVLKRTFIWTVALHPQLPHSGCE